MYTLLDLLLELDGVNQSLRYHPEQDALFHSLQVFQHSRRESDDPMLWAAALLHDVGKAHDPHRHAEAGAELLEGLVPDPVLWLVRHHLDLLRSPRKTRRKFRDHPQLRDLQRLRRWDLLGRDPDALVLSPELAIAAISPIVLDRSCLVRP